MKIIEVATGKQLLRDIERQMTNRSASRTTQLVLVALGGAIFVAVAWLNRGTIGQSLAHADFTWLIVALAFHLAAVGLAVLGWHRICCALQISQGAAIDSQFYILSTVAGRLPGGIWGFASRLYFYRGNRANFRDTTACVVIEQGLIVASGVLTLPVWIVLSRYNQRPIWSLLLVIPLAIIALAIEGAPVPFSTRFSKKLGPQASSVLATTNRHKVIRALGLYAILWIVGGLLLYATARIFQPVQITDIPTVEVAWIGSRMLALAATLLPTSFGITEVSVAILLAPIVGLPIGIVIGVVVRLLSTFGEFLSAVVLIAARSCLSNRTSKA